MRACGPRDEDFEGLLEQRAIRRPDSYGTDERRLIMHGPPRHAAVGGLAPASACLVTGLAGLGQASSPGDSGPVLVQTDKSTRNSVDVDDRAADGSQPAPGRQLHDRRLGPHQATAMCSVTRDAAAMERV